MNKEKLEYYSHLTVTLIGVFIAAYIFVRYLFLVSLPFLIAWGVAFAIRPISHKIAEGTKLPRKAISVLLTVLIVIGGLSLLISALVYALGEAWDFFSEAAESDALYDILSKIMNPINGFLGDREGAAELEAHVGEAVKKALTEVLSSLLGYLTSFVTSVPRVLIFTLITVIASVYFSLDLDEVNAFVKSCLPKRISEKMVKFKEKFLHIIVKYLRSYLILMLITFIVMLFGFLVLRVKYAVLIAFAVSLVDALPLIGVGTVLVPWSIYHILFGRLWQGIGLLIIFVIHQVIRQFTEPKILGKNLGIHPIISLVLLYFSYSLFGFVGLLLIPAATAAVKIFSNKNDSSEVA